MLPSSGYFKSVLCPFYNNGLCERPHCHYKHAKRDAAGQVSRRSSVEEAATGLCSNDGNRAELLAMVNMAIKKVQEDINRAKEMTNVSEYTPALNSSPTYIPTPVARCPSSLHGIKGLADIEVSKPSSVPEYKPTPIAQLRKLKKHHTSLNLDDNSDATYKSVVTIPSTKKRKRVEEYDPTEVKCVYKNLNVENMCETKKIKFSDNESNPNHSLNTQSYQSHDLELDNEGNEHSNDITPCFSDDSDSEITSDHYSQDIHDKENVKAESKSLLNKQDKENITIQTNPLDIVDKILDESRRTDEKIKIIKRDVIQQKKEESSQKKELQSRKEQEEVKQRKETCQHSIEKCQKNNERSQQNNDKIEQITSKSPHYTDKSQLAYEKSQQNADKNLQNKEKSIQNKEKTNRKGNQNVKEKILHGINYSQRERTTETKSDFKKPSVSTNEYQNSAQKHVTGVNKYETEAKSLSRINSKEKSIKCDKAPKDNVHKLDKRDKHDLKDRKPESQKKTKFETNKKHNSQLNIKANSSKSSDSHTYKSSKSPDKKIKSEKHKFSEKKTLNDEKSSKFHLDQKKTRINTARKSFSGKSNVIKDLTLKKVPISKTDIKKDKVDFDKKSPIEHPKKEKLSKMFSEKQVISKSHSGNSKQTSSATVISESSDSVLPDSYRKIKWCSSSSDSEEEANASVEVDTDLDEHDTFEECWRIFNETPILSSNKDPSLNKIRKLQEQENSEKELIIGKKRVAHQPSLIRPTSKTVVNRQISPGEAMHNRLKKIQQMYSQQNEKRVTSAFFNTVNHFDSGKKRIAHVPNASLLAEEAQKQRAINQAISENKKFVQPQSTIGMTLPKGEKRIAHIPSSAMSNRPTIPTEYGSRVASTIRQRYLNLFIDECLKFCPSEEDAFTVALDEEKNAYDRSTNKTVYLNVAVNTLKRLRDRAREGPPLIDEQVEEDIKPSTSTVTQVRKTNMKIVLDGPKALKTSFSIEKNRTKIKEDELKGSKLYSILKQYILAEDGLLENGFPRLHPTETGKAIIEGIYNKKFNTSNSLERICCRCQKKYKVTIKGNYIRPEECVYHWGRLWKRRTAGVLESRYSCCQGDSQCEGCCVGQGHVHEGLDADSLKGFVKTLPKSPPLDGNFGIYALDCEMCYTTKGVELSRITVINPRLKSVYETLVIPEHPVLDHNTRFSGITEEDLIGVTTTLRDVQAVLLNMFNDKTILIGHSLESDFRALRLIHNTVVDTSIVFPHKMGLPYKRALRTLMAENLNKIIQNSVDGHDSQEDAVACMELMLWKVKEDLRRMNR